MFQRPALLLTIAICLTALVICTTASPELKDEKTHDKSKPAEPTSHDEKSEAPKDENPNDMNKHTEALGNSIFTKEGQRYGPGSTFREDKTINKTHYPMTDWWQTNKMIS